MKLYLTPGACSLTAHIVLQETGLPYETELVDLETRKTESGRDFTQVNPKGYVPVLEFDDKQILTEVTAIVQYLAELAPDRQLAPAVGGLEQARLQEWLGFISTELHKPFGLLYDPTVPEDIKNSAIERLKQRFSFVDEQLASQDYLLGGQYTVADTYLFNMLFWAGGFGLDLSELQSLTALRNRIMARPEVIAVLKQEGLAG